MALHETLSKSSRSFAPFTASTSRPEIHHPHLQSLFGCADSDRRFAQQESSSRIQSSLGSSTSGRLSALSDSGLGKTQGLNHFVFESTGRLSSRSRRGRSRVTRKESRKQSRLAAIMSVDAGGVTWPAINLEVRDTEAADVSEPLSCLYIGPIDEAEKAHLEALYMQARDSYYSGRPLILDEMFDKVETRLRNLRSQKVLKYPRCSLKKFAAYSDAEEDTSQLSTLMAVWGALGLAGAFVAVVPPLCAATSACERLNEALEPWYAVGASHTSPLASFLIALGLLGGVPLANAAVQQVKSLLRGEVVALKGCCPNCGEEVYAFLDAKERKPRHKSECHVCEHPLVFQATIETSKRDGKQWAYGRVYLVTRSRDLEPQKEDRAVR